LGEKSNKNFFNINKSFYYKSYFKSFIIDGVETISNTGKIKAAHDFNSDLYSLKVVNDPARFHDSIKVNAIEKEHDHLYKEVSEGELTEILKSCGDTAAGPDGIGYKLLKACWKFYVKVLKDSSNWGLVTGELAPSHREAVICLLENKNKDKRLIQNLRSISLSNCDIKIVTKALTKRCLPDIINHHQVAYVVGRQVHDNLRAIDITKQLCVRDNKEAYVISLDAKKAFDSIDHEFIVKVLEKFEISSEFIKIFRLL
jgi:hypothetical protein